MKSNYEIIIRGYDNTPISTCISGCSVESHLKGNNKWLFNNDFFLSDTSKSSKDIRYFQGGDGISDHPIIELYRLFCDSISFTNSNQMIVGFRKDGSLKEKDCSLYSIYKNQLYFGNIVGSIRRVYSFDEFKDKFGNVNGLNLNKKDNELTLSITVEIRSRFDSNNRPFFLFNLLTHGNLRFNDYRVHSSEDESLFDKLLLWRLKDHLLKAYEKGAYRAYNSFYENSAKIKGYIDFPRHIRLNLGLNNGMVAHAYREKSADNYLNHLILYAYEYLKKKYYSEVIEVLDNNYEIMQILNLLRNETHFPKYSKAVLVRKCENPIAHPYYSEYEDLRKTCISILRDEGFSMFDGSAEEVQGILYYIPDLWEEYLESKIVEHDLHSQLIIPIFSKGQKNDEKAGHKYTYKSRPDFVFYDRECGEPFMILDAKYIPRWFYHAHARGKISSVIGDYDKCIRDMNSVDVLATGTVFPFGPGDDRCRRLLEYNEEYADDIDDEESKKINESNAIELRNKYSEIIGHRISSYNNNTTFYTVPVFVPEVKEETKYNDWKKEFDEIIDSQVKKLGEVINIEREKYQHYRNCKEQLSRDIAHMLDNNPT